MARLKTVFMGSDAIVLPLLDSIIKDHAQTLELVGVFAQPDRRQGRGMKLHKNVVKEWAVRNGIPARQPDKPTADDEQWLKECGCELLLVMAYGHLLRDSLLAIPRLPPLNFHASLLPELRGASPIDTAIATGRDTTGITLMRIVKKMDSGAILDVEKVSIEAEDNRASLTTKLADACVPLLSRNVPTLLGGELAFREQDENAATYCRILDKDDSNMDFSASALELHNRCRALHLWPGTAFNYQGQRIKVGQSALSSMVPVSGTTPGTVIESGFGKDGLHVATADGVISLLSLQRPGGKMLPASEFLRGMPIPSGSILESSPMKPLERIA